MVDTERMRRVLKRIGPKPPGPPPPPPGGDFLRLEEELTSLCRRTMAGSRGGRETLRRVIQASVQRQRELRREYYREQGRMAPPPLPPHGPPPGEGPLSLIRRAWLVAGELEEGYGHAAEAERNRERKQLFLRLERSAGESRRQLRRLLDRGM